MSVYKDGAKWRVVFRYTDFRGETKQTQKRGFKTRREALAWEREELRKKEAKLDMTFGTFFGIYAQDKKGRVKENTWNGNVCIIQGKILPYFEKRKMEEIEVKDIIAWQNELLAFKYPAGNGYSQGYLKTIHAQISAMFSHAVRFYGLPKNPAKLAGSVGKEEKKEMLFWTQDEYLEFIDSMMEKPVSYYAFEILYYTGIRVGELLALTPEDFDFKKKTLRINKSYQRIKGRDVITVPKTRKSNRTIALSQFLCEEVQEYMEMLYGLEDNERMFTISKSYLRHEMNRGSKETGVKRIRVHDLRHSAVSLLIEMGFSALAIADRMGHEAIDITYRYAHLFPNKQAEMADQLDMERRRKENKDGESQ